MVLWFQKKEKSCSTMVDVSLIDTVIRVKINGEDFDIFLIERDHAYSLGASWRSVLSRSTILIQAEITWDSALN